MLKVFFRVSENGTIISIQETTYNDTGNSLLLSGTVFVEDCFVRSVGNLNSWVRLLEADRSIQLNIKLNCVGSSTQP